MSFDHALLDILCCPLTQLPLERLSESKLELLNAAIRAKQIKNESKVIVEDVLTAALVTRDGKLAYPIRDGIPVLLIEQGIAMAQCD